MEKIMIAFGCAGAFIAGLFGGWSGSLTTLVALMAIDYATGLVVAAVFHTSPKTSTGTLESNACIKGLFRKCYILVLVLVAYRIDMEFGTTYIRDGVCIAYIISESISIVENCGLMGIPVPQRLIDAIDLLKKRQEE